MAESTKQYISTLNDLIETCRDGELGFRDAALQSLLRSASHHRHFPLVRGLMHDVHARLTETMPLIPLWQLPYTVAIHDKLRVPEIDPHAVFANVLEWKLSP